jgi:hypothetical protein
MQLNIYFHADTSAWWSNEMRTNDGGKREANWLYYYGNYFVTPIGEAFRGDIDLTNDPADRIRGELHLRGLTLSTTLTGP